MKSYVKFSTYELVFQRFTINLISENPWKLMFGTKKYAQSSWLSTGENRSSLSHFVLELFKKQTHSWICWTTPTFILKKRFILDFRRFKIQKLPTFISVRIYFGFRISEKSKMNLPTYENSSVLYFKSRENPE
jgi:hypothetical protein